MTSRPGVPTRSSDRAVPTRVARSPAQVGTAAWTWPAGAPTARPATSRRAGAVSRTAVTVEDLPKSSRCAAQPRCLTTNVTQVDRSPRTARSVSPLTTTVPRPPTRVTEPTRPPHSPCPSRRVTLIRVRLPMPGHLASTSVSLTCGRPGVHRVAGPAVVGVRLGGQVRHRSGGGPPAAAGGELRERGRALVHQGLVRGRLDRVVGGRVLGVVAAVHLAGGGVAERHRCGGPARTPRRCAPPRPGPAPRLRATAPASRAARLP